MRRNERFTYKTLRNRRTKRILKKTLTEWIGKLEQKSAKRTIKDRKRIQGFQHLQRLRMQQSYAKWSHYLHKRQHIKATYKRAFQLYRQLSMHRFCASLRTFHIRFRALQGKSDLARSHYSVAILRKSLQGLEFNIASMFRNKEKLSIALQFWAHSRYKRVVEGLVQHAASRKWKRRMKDIALEMRRGDLVSAALQRVQKVGGEWKTERLKIATKARVQREQKVWKIVAKFAQRWKEKTIKRRAIRQIEATAKQKNTLIYRKGANIAKEILPRIRPQPRRPSPQILTSPTPPLTNTARTQLQSPRSRLESIEAELMAFKFEKEKVIQYEVYVNANPDNPMFRTQLVKMKDRLNDKKARVKTLLEEIDKLKSIA